MSKRYAQVVLLMEDKQHQAFLTRLLQALGYPPHKLRVLSSPAGQGSGEQYVRECYSREVRELRHRLTRSQHQALVVMIDADDKETGERLQQLARELEQAGLDPRGESERIAVLVPRRNIMTWIEWLLGKQVNETDSYPELKGRERECQPAVARLVELCRSDKPLPEHCPASLIRAIKNELPRL